MAKSKKTERKVKSIQKYTFEVIHYEDGYSTMSRNNDGFSVVELLGVVSIVQNNLLGLFESAIKPADETKVKSTNSPLIHIPSE